MWNFLKSVPHLYRILKPTPYAHEIMAAAKATGSNVEMLTAIPRRTALPGAEQDKREWMEELFPGVKVNIGPYSADKWKWAAPGHIIIDDRTDNIQDWVEKGQGIGILHLYDNHKNTLDWIKAITTQQYFI
jgi:5'(3')-deoxyribonucleotidase